MVSPFLNRPKKPSSFRKRKKAPGPCREHEAVGLFIRLGLSHPSEPFRAGDKRPLLPGMLLRSPF